MNRLVNDHTARRVTGSNLERPRRGQGNAPIGLLTALLLAPGLVFTHDALAVGETTRISVNSGGSQAGLDSPGYVAMSADGRFVAFSSDASNLVPGDTNRWDDIFVHDRLTHQTSRVSVDSAGQEGDSFSDEPALSANGRFAAFHSGARNLAPGDTNSWDDVFVHDRLTHQTTRVSVNSAGHQGNSYSREPAISANGRFVAFTSLASNLVPGDIDDSLDVFVHDRQTQETTRVSVDSAGQPGNGNSIQPAISANGRFVVFSSNSTNLAAGDTNEDMDVFVHDRLTHQTTRVSVDSAGTAGNARSYFPAISADGRFVAFVSVATNLVPGDMNENWDVFVHDRLTHQTTCVSVDADDNPGDSGSGFIQKSLSADGRFVAFSSGATNLVPGDTNGESDVFVRDRLTRQTTRVSIDSDDNQGAGPSGDYLSLSADGRFAAFISRAANLVPGDTNGIPDVFIRDRLLDRSATADLGITQTADPAPFVLLSPLTYTLTAVNHGPDTATEVTVNDRPALLSGTVVSVVPSQGSCSQGAPFVCYLGMLAPGASSTITVTLQPRWRDTVSLWNTAQVNAAPVDGKLANNQSTLRTDVAP